MFLFRRIINRKRSGIGLAILLLLQFILASALPASAAQSPSADVSFASGSFRKVWERSDLPVYLHQTQRSYTWGPEGWAFGNEPYAESPNGKRLVQYFDKTRMEITRPQNDPNGAYYVTNGLLVKEMVSGQLQEGDTRFRAVTPSEVPVAGDAVNNPGPTYHSFQSVASLNLDKRVAKNTGGMVITTIDRNGTVGSNQQYGDKYNVKYSQYNNDLGHNIADVFWNFMNQQGPVYQNGANSNGKVIDWLSTMGLPLTDAYWSQVTVAGKQQDVLIQLFERRVLTYTPANPDGFKVEMGNVGAHYYDWRYPGVGRQAPWAVVNVINDANCGALTIALSGQDNLTLEIPNKTTKTYKLAPGTYNYKATACSFVPEIQSKTFNAGSNGDWRFFVQ
ncbi:MAG TPA: hypothetical protein VH186_25500 [Chloroflexia bacterium]|nr:hypothetical protein [Chloroflexia bacterium]